MAEPKQTMQTVIKLTAREAQVRTGLVQSGNNHAHHSKSVRLSHTSRC